MNKYEKLMMEKFGDRYYKYRKIYNDNNFKSKLDFPLHIDIDLRDACNLKCPACHTINRGRSKEIIDKNLLISIANECKNNKLCAVNLGGCGEPLIEKELLIETIKIFKEAEVMDIFIHTNGLLLDEQTSEKIIDAGVTFLCISIDAATAKTYKKVRGGDFEKLLNNVNNFLKIRGNRQLPILRVSFLPTEINYNEMEMFMQYWKGKADLIEIQDYSYVEGGPKKIENIKEVDEKLKKSIENCNASIKRIAILAPNLLSKSCGADDAQYSIENKDTFDKYKDISNYWKTISNID